MEFYYIIHYVIYRYYRNNQGLVRELLKEKDDGRNHHLFFCVDTWIRTKDPHHVKVIL